MTTRSARKSRGIYANWSENAMQQAITAIKEKKMGFLKASKEFKVPKTTLRRHFFNQNKVAKDGKIHLKEQPIFLKF